MRKRRVTLPWKGCFALFLLCIGLAVAASPAYALNWLSSPAYKPMNLEEMSMEEWRAQNGGENSDWVGVYYAKGMGLELKIYSNVYSRGMGGIATDENGNPGIYISIHDYNRDQAILMNRMLHENGEDQFLISEMDGSTLTRTAPDTIQLDFSEEAVGRMEELGIRLYMNQTSIEFTAIEKLEKEAAEGRWTGTYVDDSQDTEDTVLIFYSLKQLYGTEDYMCQMAYTQYREETSAQYFFFTEKGDWLVYAYPPGIVSDKITYTAYGMTAEGDLYDPWDYVVTEEELANPPEPTLIMKKCSNHPAWEDDADGYFG